MYRIAKEFHFGLASTRRICPPITNARGCTGIITWSSWNWRRPDLNADGFVRDYHELAALKSYIDQNFDHRHLNDVLDGPSTAENMARHFFDWCRERWPETAAVRVSETPKTWAEYRP